MSHVVPLKTATGPMSGMMAIMRGVSQRFEEMRRLRQ